MKIYTEEQVIKAIADACADAWDNSFKVDATKILNDLTPIKLPSDEEIDKATPLDTSNSYEIGIMYGFEQGAKWLKEQILNQKK